MRKFIRNQMATTIKVDKNSKRQRRHATDLISFPNALSTKHNRIRQYNVIQSRPVLCNNYQLLALSHLICKDYIVATGEKSGAEIETPISEQFGWLPVTFTRKLARGPNMVISVKNSFVFHLAKE